MDDFEIDTAYGLDGFEDAGGSSVVAYANRSRKGRCAAKDDTCKGFRVKNSTLCAGHKRAATKAIEAIEADTE